MLDWFYTTFPGQIISTLFVSILPFIELRGAIPIGTAFGLHPLIAFAASVVGNMIPVPFIILFIRRIFRFLKAHSRFWGNIVTKMEAKAHDKSEVVVKYRSIGLCILVAIPLPGTGAWTGALVAAFLDMPLRIAIPSILLGVIIAGIIVTAITCGVITIF